jgi:trehalose synthase-fused probable maltokinase
VSDRAAALAHGGVTLLPEERWLAYLSRQRWFGSKSREAISVRLLDEALLRAEEPYWLLALAELAFDSGSHELYQLLIGIDGGPAARPDGAAKRPATIDAADLVADTGGARTYDAFADPAAARRLLGLISAGATLEAGQGTVEFHPLEELADDSGAPVRRLGLEQSNSSVVLGERLILKAYRQVEPGTNPELELLSFLTTHGYEHAPPLLGYWNYSGALINTTLGIVQRYVPEALNGWSLARGEEADDELFLARLGELGGVVGELHRVLASDRDDPAFCPEQPSSEALALLLATVDEEIGQVFQHLPEQEQLAPIAGREADLRDLLRRLGNLGSLGQIIRQHGDLHLGQTLWSQGRWYLVDFEGEPARTLLERRRKRSPLRDVAGMLRSFAYAASAREIKDGSPAPADFEARARTRFLDAYLPSAQAAGLVPFDREEITRMLKIFELEKAVYELRYELDNRPDWIEVPVAGLVRLLEEPL